MSVWVPLRARWRAGRGGLVVVDVWAELWDELAVRWLDMEDRARAEVEHRRRARECDTGAVRLPEEQR